MKNKSIFLFKLLGLMLLILNLSVINAIDKKDFAGQCDKCDNKKNLLVGVVGLLGAGLAGGWYVAKLAYNKEISDKNKIIKDLEDKMSKGSTFVDETLLEKELRENLKVYSEELKELNEQIKQKDAEFKDKYEEEFKQKFEELVFKAFSFPDKSSADLKKLEKEVKELDAKFENFKNRPYFLYLKSLQKTSQPFNKIFEKVCAELTIPVHILK